jgi:Xaa-Pro dipeptidase
MQLFNYEKASQLMDEAGIDVILASTRHNVGYLADYWHSVSDEYYLLWDTTVTHKTLAGIPRDHNEGPFLIAGTSEMTTLEAIDPWINERHYWGPGYYIQTWTEPDPDPGNPMDVAARVLAEKGLAERCIALEMRYLGVSYFERLRSLLPKARFVDAERVLWDLRMVKSEEEVRRIREACRGTAKVWKQVMAQARAGMTEKEMEFEFIQAFAQAGMQNERSYCIFGPAGVKLKNGSPLPSDNRLQEGQFIRVDTQGRFEGYLCNLSRVIAFGSVTPKMEQAHALVKGMVEQLMSQLKRGVRCCDVRSAELKLYENTGYDPVVPYTGHSVGRVVHEPPYLSSSDQTVLEPGMVVTLEPTVQFTTDGDIFVCLEDQFLITDDGCEWLSEDAPLDLYRT